MWATHSLSLWEVVGLVLPSVIRLKELESWPASYVIQIIIMIWMISWIMDEYIVMVVVITIFDVKSFCQKLLICFTKLKRIDLIILIIKWILKKAFYYVKKIKELTAGFEPTRAKPIGVQVQLLNHSDKSAG